MAFVGSLSGSLGLVAVTGSFEPGVDNIYSIGTASKKWNTVVSTALSGSLTKLADGTSYIIAGTSIAVSTGSNGAITISTVGVGTGDVTGPASSTDNAVARFDLTTGKIIQNSAVTISDESSNIVSIAGSATATTVNLFNTDATTVNIAGAASTATNIGNASGLTTIAGDLKVAGNDIQSSTGATAITLSGGNVIIPGDLTVQGATVTVDATTLTIEDPVIGLGFTSGSTATTAGDRGFIGGMSTGGNVALFWDNTDSTFTSARTSTGAGNDPVAITSYTPFRASSYQIGGTPGSAVAAGSAYLSSSDALNVLVNYTSTTTFTKAGNNSLEISGYSGGNDPLLKAVSATGDIFLSGSRAILAHNQKSTVALFDDGQQYGTFSTNGTGASTGLKIGSVIGSFTANPLSLSGSAITLQAAGTVSSISGFPGHNLQTVVRRDANNIFSVESDGGNNVLLYSSNDLRLKAAGNDFNFYGNSNNAFLNVTNDGADNAVISGYSANGAVTLGSLGSGNTTISGSNVQLRFGSANRVDFQRNSTSVVQLAASSDTAPFFLAQASNTVFTVGTKGGGSDKLILSASAIEAVAGGAGLKVYRDSTAVANISGVSTTEATFGVESGVLTANVVDANATTVNFARAATTLTAGASGGSTTFQGNLTGSNFLANGSLTVVLGASIGGGFGSTGATITGAGDISTNGTLLVQGATTLSGSVILGDATGDDLTFNGYAASSLIPKTTNSFDLGTPDLRWRNMYTGDLHLKNERGDWTVIEEEDFLTLTNNKSGKRYKFVLEEI